MRTIGVIYTLFFGLLLADQFSSERSSEADPAAQVRTEPLNGSAQVLSCSSALCRLTI